MDAELAALIVEQNRQTEMLKSLGLWEGDSPEDRIEQVKSVLNKKRSQYKSDPDHEIFEIYEPLLLELYGKWESVNVWRNSWCNVVGLSLPMLDALEMLEEAETDFVSKHLDDEWCNFYDLDQINKLNRAVRLVKYLLESETIHKASNKADGADEMIEILEKDGHLNLNCEDWTRVRVGYRADVSSKAERDLLGFEVGTNDRNDVSKKTKSL